MPAVAVSGCGDDVRATGATTSASETATTATTVTGDSGNTSTGGSASESMSTTAGETATAETTMATAEPTSGSTDPSSGGESVTAGTDTGGACEPGEAESCYTGPDGTLGVGVCVAGMRTCNDAGDGFGPCEGEVTPTAEDCGTPADENCLGDIPECGAALWKKRFGGVSSTASDDLAVGADDGVVITGRFDAGSSIDLGGDTFANKGSFDGFIASFDGDGGHRWSRAFGSPASDATRSVAIDSTGAVIVSGDTLGAIDLGGGLLTGVDQDIIVGKFDSQGGHLWSAIYSDPGQQIGLHCAVTSGDEVILGGVFRDSLDLGGGALVSAGGNDIYLAKLDADGQHLWSKRFGDGAVDYVSAMVVDSSDAIVQAGHFSGSLDYGGGTLTSAGSNDAFVAKLDPDGGHLWSKRFGDAGDQRVEAAATAGDGRVLIGGVFQGSIDFGGEVLTTEAGRDAFLAVFDGDGDHLWSRQMDGPGTDRVTTIAVDLAGNVLVGGIFAGTVDVGGEVLTSDALYAVFFAKYDPSGALLFSTSYDADVRTWVTNVATDSLGDAFVLGTFAGTLDIDGDPLISAGEDDIFFAKIAP